MALSKATDNRHPIEVMAAAAAEAEAEQERAKGRAPERQAQVVTLHALPAEDQTGPPVLAQPSVKRPGARAVPAARPAPSTPTPATSATTVQKRGGGVPLAQAAQAAADGVTRPRQTLVTSRGKQNAVFRWPKVDVLAVQRAHKERAGAYREHHRTHTDTSGVFRLSLSPFTATALTRALDHLDEWVDSVRNDGRKDPSVGGSQQVGLKWPVALCERLHETWERLDLDRSVDGFTLTKANLAIAGILHEVARADQWVMDVPNDDRFSEPTVLDGRLGPQARAALAQRGTEDRGRLVL